MSTATASRPAVVCCGLATLDVVQLVDRLPAADEKVAALDFFVAAGGPATNAAVTAAWCGASARLVTALPPHPLTDLIAADLAAHAVDLDIADDLAAASGADDSARAVPPTAAILVTRGTGDRAVVSPTGGASTERPAQVRLADPAALRGAGALLIDGYHRHLSLPLARAARVEGVPVILDAGSFKPYTEELLEAVDVAIVSADFAPDGIEDPRAVLDWLAARGVDRGAVSRGGRSLLWRTPGAEGEVPVAAVDVVDTLGAGDVLHGAFAFRVARWGWDDARFAEDLAWASRVAGRSLGSFGTRAWLTDSAGP